METFGRGCLYLILGFIGITVFVILTRSTIHIPWFILIPLIIFVFWIASKKSKK
ncbi:hypothetical protein [Cohnella cholangitidis]|uniref:hypothetical protein n=1 Tax=Cohnella cholangitidis TaxID=2598458 RepID=UPI0015F8322D|nr:hypothetical protein [Cohnella cholangitidis]